MMNVISYCDGTRSLFEIVEQIGTLFWEVSEAIAPLRDAGLIRDTAAPRG